MPDQWLRVTVTSPSDELAPLLTEGLLACGGTAVEERGLLLTSYIAPVPDAATAEQRVRAQLHNIGGDNVGIVVEVVPDQDWLALWRSGLQPRHIGERIVVSPTWSDVEAAEHQLVIRIDPQMAFGTGEHASTRGVLRLMQHALRADDRVIDVGSGSAILAIAAARLGAAHVIAVESDADAMPNARENVSRNGVDDRVALVHALVDEPFLAAYGGGAFDGILANVLSSVLQPLLPAFHSALASSGWAILSGILVEEAEAMRMAAQQAGFAVQSEDTEEQWWSVLLRTSA